MTQHNDPLIQLIGKVADKLSDTKTIAILLAVLAVGIVANLCFFG